MKFLILPFVFLLFFACSEVADPGTTLGVDASNSSIPSDFDAVQYAELHSDLITAQVSNRMVDWTSYRKKVVRDSLQTAHWAELDALGPLAFETLLDSLLEMYVDLQLDAYNLQDSAFIDFYATILGAELDSFRAEVEDISKSKLWGNFRTKLQKQFFALDATSKGVYEGTDPLAMQVPRFSEAFRFSEALAREHYLVYGRKAGYAYKTCTAAKYPDDLILFPNDSVANLERWLCQDTLYVVERIGASDRITDSSLTLSLSGSDSLVESALELFLVSE